MSDAPSRLRLRFETVGSIAAIVVGVAALFLSWDQARVMRAQNHASVLPAIQIDGYRSVEGDIARIGVRVANNGVGPAVIEHVALFRDGEPSLDFAPIEALLPVDHTLSWQTMIGRVLAAGEAVRPAEFAWGLENADPAALEALSAEWRRWDVRVCYCSVFGKCWIADTAGVGARARDAATCPVAQADLFEEIGADRE